MPSTTTSDKELKKKRKLAALLSLSEPKADAKIANSPQDQNSHSDQEIPSLKAGQSAADTEIAETAETEVASSNQTCPLESAPAPKKAKISELLEKKPFNSAFVNSVVYAFVPVSVPAEEKGSQDANQDLEAANEETSVEKAEKEIVKCYQIQVNNQLVMKRSDTGFWNISSVLRCLSLPKKKRKSILTKFQKYHSDAYTITNGFFAFQGLWIAESDAKVFCKTWNCYDLLQPLFDHK